MTTEEPLLSSLTEVPVSRGDKIRGFWGLLRRRSPAVSPDAIALILPDGRGGTVELSHRNLLAACNQLNTVLPLNVRDRVLNVLPPYTVTGFGPATLLPLFSGSRILFYPHPGHGRIIAELCYDNEATVLFGDETVFAGCGEAAHPYDFFSLRCALADSSLTAQTFDLWVKKFGVRILEGWVPQACGAAVSFNTPLYNRWGSCGALLPGVSYRNGVLKSDSFAGGKFVPSSALQFDDDGYLCPPADC